MSKKPAHGANLFEIQRKYDFELDEIMDFSSNINPFGPSKKALDHVRENVDKASIYPDPNYVDLKDSIARYAHVKPEHILLGAGTTSLIKNYIAFVNPTKALLNVPCYSEYENELNLIGAEVIYNNLDYHKNFTVDIQKTIDLINEEDIDLYVITNPNNPTGTILSRGDIELILRHTDVKILIDETYIEFTDKSVYSAASMAANNPNIFVTRSTSKFFASPGIRLGYGILSDPKAFEVLDNDLSLWGINIFADIMGQIMFHDEEYKMMTYTHVQNEKERMISTLEETGALKVFPSYGNFVLCKITDNTTTAADLREYLLPKKMVIRDCSTFQNLDNRFFRFCILKTDENTQLLEGIQSYFKEHK